MKSLSHVFAVSCLVAIGSLAVAGCGSKKGAPDKMSADKMSMDKMGGDKMSDDKMSDDKTGEEKMK